MKNHVFNIFIGQFERAFVFYADFSMFFFSFFVVTVYLLMLVCVDVITVIVLTGWDDVGGLNVFLRFSIIW